MAGAGAGLSVRPPENVKGKWWRQVRAKILLGANFNDFFGEADKTGLCVHVAYARIL